MNWAHITKLETFRSAAVGLAPHLIAMADDSTVDGKLRDAADEFLCALRALQDSSLANIQWKKGPVEFAARTILASHYRQLTYPNWAEFAEDGISLGPHDAGLNALIEVLSVADEFVVMPKEATGPLLEVLRGLDVMEAPDHVLQQAYRELLAARPGASE